MSNQVLCIIMGGGCGQLQSASGVLAAMDQAGIHIDKYRGSSAGACIAGLHGSGMSGKELGELIKSTPVSDLYKLSVKGTVSQILGMGSDYVYNADGIFQLLSKHMTAQASRKVSVAVTQAQTFKPYMIAATPVTVMASAAIPHIFKKVKIGDKYYVDGGVKNMIPTPRIQDIPEYKHIYMILCPSDNTVSDTNILIAKAANTFLQTMDRQIIQIYQQGWHQLPNVTVIQPPAAKVNLLGWSKDFRLYTQAYDYACQILGVN